LHTIKINDYEGGHPMRLQFPEGFLLGVSSASAQIEGGEVGSNWNDWYHQGRIKDDSDPAVADDHWNRWREDCALMAGLHLPIARMGVEWARIMPARGEVDEAAITHYRAELESGQCLSGPHKDDFEAELDGLSVKAFGSQGQTRTAAISLKLAERELFRRDTGEEPVLLLDDVLSELDARRQDFVLNQIRSGQVLITCCEPDRLSDIGKRILIENGQVREDPACI